MPVAMGLRASSAAGDMDGPAGGRQAQFCRKANRKARGAPHRRWKARGPASLQGAGACQRRSAVSGQLHRRQPRASQHRQGGEDGDAQLQRGWEFRRP